MAARTRILAAALAGVLAAAAPAAALAGDPGHPSTAAAAGASQPDVWVEGWSAASSVKADVGGDLFIPGVVRVHIPAGALPKDLIIYVRAEVVHVGDQGFLALTFGPSGTVFEKPLTVTVSPHLIRGMNVSPGEVWYDAGTASDGTLEWVPEGATEETGPASDPDGLTGKRYRFLVWHFSRYALGSIVWNGQWW